MDRAADFFVSYAGADRAWAEWIAWQLEAEGYQVVVQAWDFRPGSDFVQQMHQTVQEAKRTIAGTHSRLPDLGLRRRRVAGRVCQGSNRRAWVLQVERS